MTEAMCFFYPHHFTKIGFRPAARLSMIWQLSVPALLLGLFILPAHADEAVQRTPAPRGAYVYIGWPNDGQIIHSRSFKVWFGARNIGVAPAGEAFPDTGHHHLLIDSDLPPLDEPIPSNQKHLHFGLGETEAVIELSPGPHTLQLLMGDANHMPHNPPLASRKITITIEPGPYRQPGSRATRKPLAI